MGLLFFFCVFFFFNLLGFVFSEVKFSLYPTGLPFFGSMSPLEGVSADS